MTTRDRMGGIRGVPLRAEKGYGEVAWDTRITNQEGETAASYDVLTMVSEQPVSPSDKP